MIATGLLQGLVCYLLIARLPEKITVDCLWRACDRCVFIRFTLLRDLFLNRSAFGDGWRWCLLPRWG